MCRTPDDVKFFGRAKLGDPTAGMTDAEQASYWRASRDRMAAQAMEQAAKLEQATKALEEVVAVSKGGADTVTFLIELHRVAKVCAAALSLSRSDI